MNKRHSAQSASTPLSAEEARRLKVLADEQLLDTLPEQVFDDLTRLASFICGTPISLISLVDAKRQWFKSRVGLDVQETPRELAFCAHTIQTPDDVMVVPDATKDERFAANPLVVGEPKIRFYAGAPLVTKEGLALGTLCVIDRVPRSLSPDQVAALEILRNQVVREIELRRLTISLGDSMASVQVAKDGYRSLAQMLQEEVGSRTAELELRNREIAQQAESLRHLSIRLMAAQDNERRRIARELHDSAGQLLAAANISLSVVLSGLQRAESPVTRAVLDAKDSLAALTKEIRTMSYLLHPPMLDEAGLAVALAIYIEGIQDRSALRISVEIPEDLGRLESDLALVMFRVVQECLTNIHRHSGSPTARIRLRHTAGQLELSIEDDGIGMSPHTLDAINNLRSGVGTQGMRERVRRLGGEMTMESDTKGTRVVFHFPVTPATFQQSA